jgi:hypothetical protein
MLKTSIRDGLDVLVSRTLASEGVFELSLLKTTNGTVRGYFDSVESAVTALRNQPASLHPEGVYATLNPLRSALLARAVNRFETFAKTRAGNGDTSRRLWLPVDVDPARPSGISATEAELLAAIERTDRVVGWLREQGWPAPLRASGGNSGHALFAIDEPNDSETEALLKRVLSVLDSKFSDKTVTIDTTVANAARIWTVYGTMKRKGDHTADRPHRRSWVAERPNPLTVVTRAQLEAVAAFAAPERSRIKGQFPSQTKARQILDMHAEFQRRGWYLCELAPGKHAVQCPWAAEHSAESGPTETVLFEPQGPDDVWGFKCQHAHCANRTIKDVWELVRPCEDETGAALPGETELPWHSLRRSVKPRHSSRAAKWSLRTRNRGRRL